MKMCMYGRIIQGNASVKKGIYRSFLVAIGSVSFWFQLHPGDIHQPLWQETVAICAQQLVWCHRDHRHMGMYGHSLSYSSIQGLGILFHPDFLNLENEKN